MDDAFTLAVFAALLGVGGCLCGLAWHASRLRDENDRLMAELEAARRFMDSLSDRCDRQGAMLVRQADGGAS